MIDPTGKVITLVRDHAAVTAIVPIDPHGHRQVRGTARERGWRTPFVVIRRLTSAPWIEDQRTENAGVGTFRYTGLCYADRAVEDETIGERYADDAPCHALAGALVDAINGLAHVTFPVAGGRGVIYGIQVDGDGPVLEDPDTKERYVPVQFSVLAGTQPLAAITP